MAIDADILVQMWKLPSGGFYIPNDMESKTSEETRRVRLLKVEERKMNEIIVSENGKGK